MSISFTRAIIGINISLFVLSLALGAISNNNVALVILGAESLPLIAMGEVWRLLTYAFLHANIFHLLFNMYALWYVGDFVERYFGKREFIVVYIFTAITAGIFSSLSNLATLVGSNSDALNSISVGASGAIFGLMGLILGKVMLNNRYGVQLPVDTNQLYMIVAINLLLGFTLPGINNAAHIGGLVGGVILSLFIEPALSFDKSAFKKLFMRIAYPISILLVILSFTAQAISIFVQLSV
jgi:rhomboid protease GluP